MFPTISILPLAIRVALEIICIMLEERGIMWRALYIKHFSELLVLCVGECVVELLSPLLNHNFLISSCDENS